MMNANHSQQNFKSDFPISNSYIKDSPLLFIYIMKITVQELDEKVSGIVKDSEDTIQGGRHMAIVA